MSHFDELVCDFCLKSQSEVLIIFSSKNKKFHICDYCIEEMFRTMLNHFRSAPPIEGEHENTSIPRI